MKILNLAICVVTVNLMSSSAFCIDILGGDEDIVKTISDRSTKAERMAPFSVKGDEKLPTSVQMVALGKSYAIHMWKVRNLWGASKGNIAALWNVEYRHSIYSVIASELIKSVFKVNALGDGVAYGSDKVMLLENGGYVPMQNWEQANFNYLFLVNLLNFVVNRGYSASEPT